MLGYPPHTLTYSAINKLVTTWHNHKYPLYSESLDVIVITIISTEINAYNSVVH